MRAYGERLILKFDPDEERGDVIFGEILSMGNAVDDEFEEGMEVIVGKFAGQVLDNKIIINQSEILAINE